MNYDEQANAFLNKHRIIIELKKGENKKPCRWDCGDSYLVILKCGRKRMSFDFHDSINNQKFGLIPSSYAILACISAEMHCPDTLEDFQSEFGYEQWEGKDIFKACQSFSKRIRKFFTPEQLEELEEIQ
jgi:hypothetical protein